MEDDEISKMLENIGDAIRRRRAKLNISQEALAAAAGVHRVHMTRIEQGQIAAKLDTILKVASALEMPLSKLIKDSEKQ